MATINFLYRSTKDKANLVLRLLFRYNDTDFVFGASTKFEVSKEYWNKQHKSKSKDILITNKQLEVKNELNKIENFILDSFNDIETSKVSKEWLKEKINFYYNPPKEDEQLTDVFLEYFDYFIEIKKKEVAIGTLKKYHATRQLFIRYEKDRNKKSFLIESVNEAFKLDFVNYCNENKYAPNTISKFLKIIKAVCNHAGYNGIKISHQLDKIKTPQYRTDKIYLTFDEIQKLETINPNRLNDNLQSAKDWLIISCYTGQRVSDFMRFD